ncbi:MAG: hypothetical protein V3R99_06520 [Thermoguttaceae bacterium]
MKRYGQVAILLAAVVLTQPATGKEPVKEGGWLIEKDEHTGASIQTMEMTLHPKAEPRPALKYRLLPDDFDMVDGNAAIYYLKAIGFDGYSSPHHSLYRFDQEVRERAGNKDKRRSEIPPGIWRTMKPEDLPLEEVKEFLKFTNFQCADLKEASRRRRFDLDRNFREIEDPLSYQLGAIQSMQELARMQTLRCKVAIAEGRIDDAIEILGQQYSLARHLGQDDVLVSGLVGMACAGIGFSDALYLVQHPDAPNLYWAFASLPRPLVDLRHAMAFERQFLYLQLKVLREVDESSRPAGYWRDFLDRLIPQFGGMARDFGMARAKDDPETARAKLVESIATAYPGAKRYLIEDCGLPTAQVEAYPNTQVVLLATIRYHDEERDNHFKWAHLPYWQARSGMRSPDVEKASRADWCVWPTHELLSTAMAARTAVARAQQHLALLQTVEAIRMYGATHQGELPSSLDDLPVPAPLEPFTGKPLDYQYHGKHAVLTGHKMPGMQYRLVLRFAKKAETP